MILICPEYKINKSQITRNINKQLSPDVTKFKISDKSKYHKTVRNVNFMTFKNPNLIILQSPFQTKLFMKYNEDIFADSTFYILNLVIKYSLLELI